LSPVPSPNFEDDLVEQIISEERQKFPHEVFIDFGEPLPSRYGADRLHLMVQDPFRVFAYWEITEPSIQETLRRFPAADRAGFQVLLKWIDVCSQTARFLDPGVTSNWWFPTLPEMHYQLELGLYSEDYGWVRLLASQEVDTPRITLGPPSDETKESPQSRSLLEVLVRSTGINPEPETVESLPFEQPRQPVSEWVPTQLAPEPDSTAASPLERIPQPHEREVFGLRTRPTSSVE
jgi:hypothetical protein